MPESKQKGYFPQFKKAYLKYCPVKRWPSFLIIKRFINQIQRVLNAGRCARHQFRKVKSVRAFAGNCPLWDHRKRNNGSSVFHLYQMGSLVMDSGLSKLEISIWWIWEIKTEPNKQSKEINHMPRLNITPFSLCSKRAWNLSSLLITRN